MKAHKSTTVTIEKKFKRYKCMGKFIPMEDNTKAWE